MADEENQDLAPEGGTSEENGETAPEPTADDERDELLDRIRKLEAEARGNKDKAKDSRAAKARRERETKAKSDDLSTKLEAALERVTELEDELGPLKADQEKTINNTRRNALAQAIAKKHKVGNVNAIDRVLRTFSTDDGFDPAPESVDVSTVLMATKAVKADFPQLLEQTKQESTPRPAPPRRPGLNPPAMAAEVEMTAEYVGQLAQRMSGPSQQMTAYEQATGRKQKA